MARRAATTRAGGTSGRAARSATAGSSDDQGSSGLTPSDDQGSPTVPDSDHEQDLSEASPAPRVRRRGAPTPPPFRFFALPAELRERILELALAVDDVLDLGLNCVPQLRALFVSRRFHAEAAAAFYRANTFRLLPTHARAVERRARPLVRRIAPRYRALIARAELRFGPHWSKPPRCWLHPGAGAGGWAAALAALVGVRRLDVCVQADPACALYAGFRVSRDFYTDLARSLLGRVLLALPHVAEVRLERYSGVACDGPLVTALEAEAREKGMAVVWAPEPLPPPPPAVQRPEPWTLPLALR